MSNCDDTRSSRVKPATNSGLFSPSIQEILEEIKDERQKQALSTEEFVSDTEEIDNKTVLVACKDEHSCMQLEECITSGPRKVF